MPPAGNKASELTRGRGLFADVLWLRIELLRERDHPVLLDPNGFGPERLPDHKVLEIATLAHGNLLKLKKDRRTGSGAPLDRLISPKRRPRLPRGSMRALNGSCPNAQHAGG